MLCGSTTTVTCTFYVYEVTFGLNGITSKPVCKSTITQTANSYRD